MVALWGVALCHCAYAQGEEDSLKVERLNEVVVKSVKAAPNAPFAVSNIGKSQLQSFAKTGQELPFLFARTPGVLAWSENGVGTGTSYMRLRGAAASRINVTIDGVPLNSPEDQCVFWANMNSYAALLKGVQIQRGVGTSTNGDGAFGGTISLQTLSASYTPALEVSGSYGSYNTVNAGGSFSTGMLWNHLVFDGAYHETRTDGYIHGTSGRSGSYYGGLTYLNDDRTLTIRYKNIGNFEKTGQAWNGVTAGTDDYSLNSYAGIRTYKDMYKCGLGKYNSLYEKIVLGDDYWTPAVDGDGKYMTERYTMDDGSFWSKTTDNFWQNHNILSLAWNINEHWSVSGAVHYTHGYGYYKEFKPETKLKKFGLSNSYNADWDAVYTYADGTQSKKKVDLVRKKGLTQNTYGMIWNVNYKDENWDVTGGVTEQSFEGNHFGYITYIKDEKLREVFMPGNRKYLYYDSDAQKTDAGAFTKATYHISSSWDVFADLQYRHVYYMTNGVNDKFISNGDGSYSNQILNISKSYHFFNPKAGFSFHKNGHNAYISYARSNREPERNNYTDNGNYPAPKAESVDDVEWGYQYTGTNWYAGANMYYMGYRNQFVQTGLVSDIGENLTTNVKDSYRMGIEISAGWSPLRWLSVEGNAALSTNKIKDFDEYVATYDADWNELETTKLHYNNSTLAFSPSAILNGFLDFHYKGIQAVWHTNFVSSQYLDNTKNSNRSLPCYSTSNVKLSYDLKCKRGLKDIVFGVDFNNIFNRHYAASGWVYSSIVGEKYSNDNRYYQIGYIPMAGFTVMGNITFRF